MAQKLSPGENPDYVLFPVDDYIDGIMTEKQWKFLNEELRHHLSRHMGAPVPGMDQICQAHPQEFYDGAIQSLWKVLLLFREEYAGKGEIHPPGKVIFNKLGVIYNMLMALLATRKHRQSVFSSIR